MYIVKESKEYEKRLFEDICKKSIIPKELLIVTPLYKVLSLDKEMVHYANIENGASKFFKIIPEGP